MEDKEFMNAFSDIQIGLYNENYTLSFYEVENDQMNQHFFKISINETSNKIYFGIEFYSPRMYLATCHNYSSGILNMYT